MKATINSLFLAGLLVVVCTSCSNKKAEEKTESKTETVTTKDSTTTSDVVSLTADQYKVAAIATGKVEMRNLSNVLKVAGTIDVPPQNVVSISAPLGGYVKSSGLLPGKAVRKGQVVAVIENAEFIDIQQDYLESRSRMVFLSQELKRQQELRREEINAAKTLQQVSSDYNMMRAKISALEQKLSLIGISPKAVGAERITKTSNLYSPITGFVTASNVNRGKYVQPSDVLFELADKSDMHLALNVFEKDVRKMSPGRPVRFALANEADYNREATVFLIGKATAEDGTIPVHCHLKYPGDPAMLPGMYVKALIETTSESAPALPTEAIVQSEGKDYLFIQRDTAGGNYSFQLIPVMRGKEQEGFVAVTLPQNFDINHIRVVIKGAYALLSAMKNVEE
jgi:membrane fusion protein, heavy metal efflux system